MHSSSDLRPQISVLPRWHPDHRKSFSLFETVIAVGMLAVVFLYVSGIQGQVVYSLEYGQNLSRGLWLARGILARVDYEWATRDLSELHVSIKDAKISEAFWGQDAEKSFSDFTYRLEIEEWKLPITEVFSQMSGGESGAGGSDSGGDGGSMAKQVLGEHILKIATVEVFWPEGARRASTQLALLLVNQRAVDTFRSQFVTPPTPPAPTTPTKTQKPASTPDKKPPSSPSAPPAPTP